MQLVAVVTHAGGEGDGLEVPDAFDVAADVAFFLVVFGGFVGSRTGFFLALVEAVFDAVAAVAKRAEAAPFVGEVGGVGDAVAVARRVAVAAEGEFFAQVAFAVLFFAALAEGEAVVVVNVVVSLDEEAARAEAAVFDFW